ncbi:MAG TPA: HAMP domain-containing sensor histidine kinase [Pseudonocardiaceae bacterium]|nr:HAMP domain-containing sensor histidine kinase [Pseudonocardiaceae bacterium]
MTSRVGQLPQLARAWWLRRTLRFRITLVATTVTVLFLVVVARFASGLIDTLLLDATDDELHAGLRAAAADVAAGQPLPRSLSSAGTDQIRVLDTGGAPADGQPPLPLGLADIEALTAGQGVLHRGDQPPSRWLGTVVSAPDGSRRLVIAGAALPGYDQARDLAFEWALAAAALCGLAAGLATWLAVRSSLRPVQRMRLAAAALPTGQRLPVPEARDELRTLAEAINALLARRDEARGRLQRFTGDAAHELRSPVAAIRAQAEVAALHPDPELAQEVLAEVAADAERLSNLIDDLLVLYRSDTGELPPAGPVDVALAAQAAMQRLPATAPRVRLHVPTQSCPVWAAPAEVELALDNLLRNAARHARAVITVSVLPAVGGGIRLTVDDDGPGVPPRHRPRVFDRFYRVHDDRDRRTGGAGLGLALVAEVVRRRQGAVSVGESPEGGARFEVRWPGIPARR